MEIKWKPDGGVQLVDLSKQEWAWLRRELGRAKPEVTRDAGDGMIDQLKNAAPINAAAGTKANDLEKPVL